MASSCSGSKSSSICTTVSSGSVCTGMPRVDGSCRIGDAARFPLRSNRSVSSMAPAHTFTLDPPPCIDLCCSENGKSDLFSSLPACGELLLGCRILCRTCSRQNFPRRHCAWAPFGTGKSRKARSPSVLPATFPSLLVSPRHRAALCMHSISRCSAAPRVCTDECSVKRQSKRRSQRALSGLRADNLRSKKESPRCTWNVITCRHGVSPAEAGLAVAMDTRAE
mmetsp:Transcript_100237/g.161593  ORF Transcript_100237/g.161593 Transcript_100237/m.161593 type:complete len:223 (+) Transcript_100237:3405-4073(+)